MPWHWKASRNNFSQRTALLVCLLPLYAFADPLPAEISSPEDCQEQNALFSLMDEPHTYLTTKFADMVNGIDRFFGDARNFQENNQSVFQLDLTKLWGHGGDRNAVLSGRAKIDLPSTQKRLHLLIESNPEQITSTALPSGQTTSINKVNAPNSYAAALRFEKSREALWYFSSDAGLRFQGMSSSLFARARASYAMPVGEWRMKFAETLFWFNKTGAGATSQLDWERALSEPVLLRASTGLTWLHDKQNLEMRQDVTVYHTLDERRALQYQVSASGISQPQFHADDYVLLMSYRYRLHKKWMYLEVSPQLHYPRAQSFQASPALMLRLEALLDAARQ
jgi:hypothetical protein